MSLVRTLLVVLATWVAVAGFAPTVALADDGGKSWCAQNPDKCERMKKRRDDYCDRNPQGCESGGSRERPRHDDDCSRHPDQCNPRRHGRD